MWRNFREIGFYSNSYASLRHEILVNSANVSSDGVNRNYPTNSIQVNLKPIFGTCSGHLKLDRDYYWNSLLGVHLGRSIAFFIGERRKDKRRLEAQYLKHSNDLAELVFKIWQCSPWDLVDNDLFPNACEHLECGYPDLWRVWSDKENGYKALSLQCDNQKESIRKNIEGKLKDEIEVKCSYTFKSDQLSWLVVDIYDYIEYKVTIGRDRFYFEVEIKENRPPSIVSLLKEAGYPPYYRHFHYLENSSESNLKKIAEILNSLLTDVKLNDAVKNLEWKKAETAKKLKQFRDGLKSIISTAEYGFKGIDGECNGNHGCKDWKP